MKSVLLFALLCILEKHQLHPKRWSIFTLGLPFGQTPRKKIFNKGKILTFDRAITDKLHQIVDDLRLGELLPKICLQKILSKADVKLHGGSCLDILPKLKKVNLTIA